MATLTREEFVKSVLMELRAVDPDETVEASDYEKSNQRIQQTLEELYADSLIPFNLDGPIPARYAVPLAYVCAADQKSLFPTGDRVQEIILNARSGMSRLWALRDQFYSGEPTAAVYF